MISISDSLKEISSNKDSINSNLDFLNKNKEFVNIENSFIKKRIYNMENSDNSINNNSDYSQNSSESNEGEVHFEIILDEGKIGFIKIGFNDDIYAKVIEFCKKNNYTIKVRDLIIEQILIKLDELINKLNILNKKKIKTKIIINKNNTKLKRNKSFDGNFKKNKFCRNYGDYTLQQLYKRQMGYKNNVKEKLKKKREENNSKLSPDFTFHPKISKKSREMTNNLNKKIKIEDRLIALGKEREKRLLKKVAEKSFIENNYENTFMPKVNNYMLNRNKSQDIFNKLYKQAGISKTKAQKEKERHYKDNYPFKPKISKMSKKMNDSKYEQVIKRFYDKRQQKKEKILHEHEPPVIKKKKKLKHKIKIDITDKMNKSFDDKYTQLRSKNTNNNNNLENNVNISEKIKNKDNNENKDYNKDIKKDWIKHNDEIINKLKEVKFKEIFNLLDKNKKGYISYSNISYLNIPDKTMISLTPIVEEVNRNKNKRFNYQEFKKIINESLTSSLLEE